MVGGGDALSRTDESSPDSDNEYDDDDGTNSSSSRSLSLSSLSSPVAVFSAEAEQAPLLGDLLFGDQGDDREDERSTFPTSSTSAASSSSYSSARNHRDRPKYVVRDGDRDPAKLRAREAIVQIFQSPLYLWTVTTGAIISGSTVFILYFVTQILEALDFFGSTTMNFVFCAILLVASPIPGNMAGAYYVQKSLGGR